jgi:Na+/proline symporter
MWTLIGIGLYLVVNIAVGVWVARRVHSVEDYLLAGRNLPLYLVSATMFSTWFGSETILGVSSEVAQHGLIGAIEDPFGAALCLYLIGAFLASRLFRLNLLTFADLYRIKFGKTAERIAGILLVASYLGWIAAQFIALGLMSELLLGVHRTVGILIGFTVVLTYTITGGMWSIAVLDFVHNFIIIGSLIIIVMILGQNSDIDDFRFLPKDYFTPYPTSRSWTAWLNYFAAWIVIGLGSLPQQDVFQRIYSAKNLKTAIRGSYIGAGLYLSVGLLPLFIAVYIRIYHTELLKGDPQTTIPNFILHHMPTWVAFLFAGALISAVLNCASAAILAPAGVMSENLVRSFLRNQSRSAQLWSSRLCVLFISFVSLGLAFSHSSIHELVAGSSALSLVSLFVPMLGALYFQRLSPLQGNLSMIVGMITWLAAMLFDTEVNALLYGLGGSLIAFVLARVYHFIYKNPLTIKSN